MFYSALSVPSTSTMYRLDNHSSSDFPFGNVVVMAAASGEKSKKVSYAKLESLQIRLKHKILFLTTLDYIVNKGARLTLFSFN